MSTLRSDVHIILSEQCSYRSRCHLPQAHSLRR